MEREELLQHIGLEAGACLKRYFGTALEVRLKGESNLVTAADEAAEALIVGEIRRHFPQDEILAEEGGRTGAAGDYQWIIDPLDGTTNFAHNFPHFSVSIALAHLGRVTAGLVYDPIKDECFQAQLGRGATLNGDPIAVARRASLADALAATGFSYDRRQRMDLLLQRVRRILTCCQGLRRLGSAALDLAYVACGRFDLFLEDGLNAWDIAAGQLLVTEAGGITCGLDGELLDLFGGHILATNQALHAEALLQLAEPRRI